jgi:hypothetical protein
MALAQEQDQEAPAADHSAHHGQQIEQPSMGGGPMMGQGMMGQGMMGSGQPGQQTGQQMMGGCPMMGGMMGQGKQGMMGQGGMGPGMMHGSMGPGMMQSGMGPGMMQGGGMGALFGSRVTPVMNLSAEDVRGYLGAQLDRLDNKRLKVGDIKADDGTITADIVTVDNSLVQRLKVDRHTGAIEYRD